MRHKALLLALGAAALLAVTDGGASASPVSPAVTDSTAVALRISTLKLRRDSLEKEIRIQDSRRDRRINGVAPLTMEAINNRQDSICLDLRSRLTDVIIELKELSALDPVAVIGPLSDLLPARKESPLMISHSNRCICYKMSPDICPSPESALTLQHQK